MNEEKLTKEQEYCKAQIADLMQKQANLNFQLDQVKASLSVFNNLMAEETKKDVAKEVLKEEKSEDTKGGK